MEKGVTVVCNYEVHGKEQRNFIHKIITVIEIKSQATGLNLQMCQLLH